MAPLLVTPLRLKPPRAVRLILKNSASLRLCGEANLRPRRKPICLGLRLMLHFHIMTIGAFTFVLHSHLPYCRMAGRWPHGEEWIHEAAAETYVPLLNALFDLYEAGVPAKATVGVTPILCEQLADSDIQEHFDVYLADRAERAAKDIELWAGSTKEPEREAIAQFYLDWYTGIRRAFNERFKRDLVGAFRRLQDAGVVEIITCGATHGYLPLLSCDSSIHAQIRAAVTSYRRHFGRDPRAIWLPECAYRPAYITAGGRVRPGIETFLAEHNLRLFFVETHILEGGKPVGKAAGDAVGPYGAIKRRYVIPASAEIHPEHPATTYQPYVVLSGPGEVTDPPVAVMGRNNRTGQQVWSQSYGYPGDFAYREFHKKDGVSGLQYWSVSGAGLDLALKGFYDPAAAAVRVREHARHFAWVVGDALSGFAQATGRYGIIASNYDTELFGHWWFEGVEWIKQVLTLLAQSETVQLCTASEYLEEHPPSEVLAVPEGSWGSGGTHFTWDNADTHWMWEPIHAAEARMEALVARFPQAESDDLHVLQQTAREVLLLQSSDWPFLVTTGQAKNYAIERFSQHVDRFNELADGLEAGRPDTGLAAEYWERDKVFPDIDYRWWAAR
jgi:1,4-alpha-glucan branching enzyme